MSNIYEQDLPRNAANHLAISPLSFLERSALVHPDQLAIVHGPLRQTWAQTYARCRQLADALQQRGIGLGDTVAVMLPNTPPMVEAHFGIPMSGAVLNTLNTRLDAEAIAFMLDHGEAKVVIVDPEFAKVMERALSLRTRTEPVLVIDAEDALYTGEARRIGTLEFAETMPEYCGVISKKPTIKAVLSNIEAEEANFDFAILDKVVSEARYLDIRRIGEETAAQVQEVETTAESGDDEVILDIRSMEEHDDKPLVVEGREIMHIPFFKLATAFGDLPKEKTYLLYCDRGVMSKLQALYLKEQGFDNVKVYRP